MTLGHCCLISDYFNLDLNQRKFQNVLFKKLKILSTDEKHYLETCRINKEIISYLHELESSIDIPLNIENEVDITTLFKAAGICPYQESDSPLEKLMDYLLVLHELCGIFVFFMVNIKSFVTKEELLSLYQFAAYQKITIMLIENKEYPPIAEWESIYIIDADGCEIFKDEI